MSITSTMTTQACFRTSFLPLSHCSSCSSLRFHSSISSYINHGRRWITPPRLVVSGSRVVKCSASGSEIGPGGDGDDKDLLKAKTIGTDEDNYKEAIESSFKVFAPQGINVGWGCGWHNIQMLTSHLLFQRPQEAKPLLFGGSGFVPDIPSLQTWLEIAWNKGFDTPGSNHFNRKISGKRAWIGTTECAALFRSFGLRARIVDFTTSSTGTSTPQIVGPMDRYLNRPHNDASSSNNNICVGEIVKGHQLLFNWVRSYFSDTNMTTKSGGNRVIVTQKAPLYFQHDGHSRTIVGIQLKRLPNGTNQHNLLIFDPAHKTQVLESCLSKKFGWQRYIKRGVHTLKKTEYQLCYIEPGIATGAELQKLKTLDSTHFEF